MGTKRDRLWLLIFAGIAIVAMVLLAAAFHDLDLTWQGRPLPRGAQSPTFAGFSPGLKLLDILYVVVYVSGVLLVVVGIIWVIVSRKAKKIFIRNLLIGCVPLLILLGIRLWLGAYEESGEQQILEQTVEEEAPPPELTEGSPPPPAEEPILDPPGWSVWVMALVLALVIATALVAAVWFLWLRRRRQKSPMQWLAQEAQEALDALLAGADVRDTVMRCYFEMSRVLWLQKNVIRHDAMTPREFEISLEEVGLPDEAVRQLTRLFEAVRYGAKIPGGSEARQAVACLTNVVEACRS